MSQAALGLCDLIRPYLQNAHGVDPDSVRVELAPNQRDIRIRFRCPYAISFTRFLDHPDSENIKEARNVLRSAMLELLGAHLKLAVSATPAKVLTVDCGVTASNFDAVTRQLVAWSLVCSFIRTTIKSAAREPHVEFVAPWFAPASSGATYSYDFGISWFMSAPTATKVMLGIAAQYPQTTPPVRSERDPSQFFWFLHGWEAKQITGL